jgi:SAM-dependent methyltransferase
MDEPDFLDYRRYVKKTEWAAKYSAYQKKYAVEPRESDKKSARLVVSALHQMQLSWKPRILDIGCSTGNFLAHLQRLCREADISTELIGGELIVPHGRGMPAASLVRRMTTRRPGCGRSISWISCGTIRSGRRGRRL